MITNIRLVISALVLGLAVAGCSANDAELGGTDSNERDELSSMPGDVEYALRALPSAEVTALHKGGIPMFVRGNLGTTTGTTTEALKPALHQLAPVFRLKDGNLQEIATEVDELGKRHHRFQQMKDGLPVVGGELIVHVDVDGTLYAVNSTARDGVPVDPTPALDAAYALSAAKALPGYEAFAFGPATLKYVFSSADNALHLAYELEATGARDGMPARDILFIDAHSGALADRMPTIHTALNRKVYSSNNTGSLPGTLKRSEGGAATSDAVVNGAYDNVGATYNFFKTVFNRDSYNGNGAQIVSSVHYEQSYDNAYWDGVQMVYGDGDGFSMGPLANDYDITVHELAHAVTDYEARLVYQNEPGALNEAMSDIFAAAADSHARGGVVDAKVWKIGEQCWTPNQSGDAMRYMADPTADGQSRDYYPTRYQGSEDFGGVHLNSGIANLAFKLLVTGGTHPRGRTSIQVTGIGMEKARAIFYRALTQYMTSTTNFAGARAATKQAAAELYDAATATSVEQAWAAVGVGSAPGGTTGGGTTTGGTPSSTVALQNNVAVNSVSGNASDEKVYTLQVPAGASNLKFQMSGGTGDADLYVKFGSKPTTSSYDYRPYLGGNNEVVNVTTATAGTWYVVVRGYSAFSGVTLLGSYTASSGTGGSGATELRNSYSVTGLTGAAGTQKLFSFTIPSGATTLSISMAGGTGDADLYVRFGSPPTANAFDYRPYLSGNNETVSANAPAAGTVVYILVNGYQAYSGVSLTATAR